MKDIVLIVFLLLFSLCAKSQQVSVNDSVATFVNDSCNVGLIAQTKFKKLFFEKRNDRRINILFTGSEYHFIILKVNTEKKLTGQYLSIDNTSLDKVRIYKIQPGNAPALLYEGGQFIPSQENSNYVGHTPRIDINPGPS